MKKENIHVIDFTATLRPRKIAYLIDTSTPFKWIIEKVIPNISAYWGSGNYFYFPITTELENNSRFPYWMQLLKKYDPDLIISTGALPGEILACIKAETLTFSDIFEFDPQSLSLPRLRLPDSIPFETLFKNSNISFPLIDHQSTGDELYDLWLYSIYGYLGEVKTPSTCIRSSISISIPEIKSDCEEIFEGRYNHHFEGSPMKASMKYLGHKGAVGYLHDELLPCIIIIGNKMEDWCLFQTLYNFYPKCRWFPQDFLKKDSTTFNRFPIYLYDLLNSVDCGDPRPFITSASLTNQELKNVIETIIADRKELIPDTHSPTLTIEQDFSSNIKNWLEWGDANNFQDIALVFSNGLSLQRAPVLAPKHFKIQPSEARYLIELHSYKYKYLAHKRTNEMPMAWHNLGSITKSVSKKTYLGGLVFNPVPNLNVGGHEIESVLRSPRLKSENLLDVFGEILSNNNLKPNRSISSINIQAVLGLWEDSIDSFFRDYFKNDSSKIFEIYKKGKKAKGSSYLGLQSTAGIEMAQKFLFSFPLEKAFVPNLTSVNDAIFNEWLDKQILIRGEKLKCTKCGIISFYSESEISRSFICLRCRSKILKSFISMGNPEPRPLYDMNPLIYGLQETDSDLVLYGVKKIKDDKSEYFSFECEIEIQNDQNIKIQEIDIIGNLDGHLVIGECKSNGNLNGNQLKKYVQFCREYNIEKFYCISDKTWTDVIKKNIQAEFNSLKYTEVVFISKE